MGKWLGVGIAIGAGVGVAMGNVALGIGVGVAIEVALNAAEKRPDEGRAIEPSMTLPKSVGLLRWKVPEAP